MLLFNGVLSTWKISCAWRMALVPARDRAVLAKKNRAAKAAAAPMFPTSPL